MVSFAALDYGIVGLFLAAIFALGFSAKLRDASMLQYLVAGRNLSLPVFVTSIVCTWYGGILGIGESVSYYGAGTMLLLGVPYYVFALFYAFRLADKVRDSEHVSLPERLTHVFGSKVGLAASGLIFLLGVPSAHVLMLGTLVQSFTGSSLEITVVAATMVGSLFLYRGGLLADVRVSVLAFAMMYFGFAMMVIFCLVNHSGSLMAYAKATPAMVSWNGGQAWTVIVGFFILGAWTLVDPGFHQRVASTASPEVSRKGLKWAVACWAVFDLMTITTGLFALSLMKEVPANPLLIFPLFGNQILPSGLKAVFFCGMLGTILCAMVGYALVSGATFGREIVAGLAKVTDDHKVKVLTRVGIFVSLLVAIGLALSIRSVVSIWYNWGGVVTGALLVPIIWSYLVPERTGRNPLVFASILASSVATTSWWIYGTTHGNPFLSIETSFGSVPVGTILPGLLVSGIILAIGSKLQSRQGVR